LAGFCISYIDVGGLFRLLIDYLTESIFVDSEQRK